MKPKAISVCTCAKVIKMAENPKLMQHDLFASEMYMMMGTSFLS